MHSSVTQLSHGVVSHFLPHREKGVLTEVRLNVDRSTLRQETFCRNSLGQMNRLLSFEMLPIRRTIKQNMLLKHVVLKDSSEKDLTVKKILDKTA